MGRRERLERLVELLFDTFGIVMGVFIGGHLAYILFVGPVLIFENREFILYFELVTMVWFIYLGIGRLLNDLRK